MELLFSIVTGRLGSRFVLILDGGVVAISVGVDVPCSLNRDRRIGVYPATVAPLTSDIFCALCNKFSIFYKLHNKNPFFECFLYLLT